MNRKLLNDSYTSLVRTYTDAINVPPFKREAIERRVSSPRSAAAPRWRSYAFAAAATIALIAWSAPAIPALIADVQNAMQMFLQRDGQMVPATNREVTIEQAARDLPFRVIPPAGVPIATPPMIQEVSIAGDPSSAHLMVQYSSNLPGPKPGFTALPALTIMEASVSAPPTNIAFTVHPGSQAPFPPRPNQPPPPGAVQIRALTVEWVEGGTRISLLGTPGAITQAQLEGIRRAMGGY